MKKLLISLMLLLSSITAMAFSSFSMGVNDTVWYNPYQSPNGKTVHVHAQMDARVDSWDITFTYPSGMTATSMIETADMRIPYVNSSNDTVTLMVTLYTNAPFYTMASANIVTPGYWYNPILNVFESYGTVKWEPGYYDRMFDVFFSFASGFSSGNITLTYHMSCSPDNRGNASGPLFFSKQVAVVLGNRRGDVNGDDAVDVADVTLMIACALETITFDPYQLEAGDMNCDGKIDVDDVTILVGIVNSMTSGTLDIGDFFDS